MTSNDSQPAPGLAYWTVTVTPRALERDGHARHVRAQAHRAGLANVSAVRFDRLYLLQGRLTDADVRRLATELLADPVSETWLVSPGLDQRPAGDPAVEVHYKPGVMDPAALSARQAGRRLLAADGDGDGTGDGEQLVDLHTAVRYSFPGLSALADLEQLARQVLANDCVQAAFVCHPDRRDPLPTAFAQPPVADFELRHVPLRQLDDDALTRLSREGHLFLSLDEMRAVRDHFAALDRDPTDLELETLAQTWSEHCVHKTLKSQVLYKGPGFGNQADRTVEVRFDNLLKDTIAHATDQLAKDWCLSVFVDNAGVIAFDDDYGIAFKVETHNHPSAIEPYGGSATGIGGCIRDVMGCGLGAKPIASTDVFCLAPPDFDAQRLPRDVLHPRRVFHGVVQGVRDYGNRMGIPTVNGAVYFDERYLGNPLVYCGCVGLIPRRYISKAARPGDRIVVAGGRTGRDGIHGATFSSAELTDQHADEFSHAVQIGNAIEEKKVLDALLLARDHATGCLYTAVTDCGAGGLSSAVGEMGETLGADVELADVPLKYAGLRYDEIWISEAQERMVFAVPPDRLDTLLTLFAAEEVEATVIGTFTDDRVLRVRYQGEVVGELEMAFLHNGYPQPVRRATWTPPAVPAHDTSSAAPTVRPHEPPPTQPVGAAPGARSWADQALLAALSSYNVASKEWVIRQYDHEVQGGSVIKPLMGPGEGPMDAAVLRPRLDSQRGIALGVGLCPERTAGDPYWMAVAAVDEALRNVICVGADPGHTAILDNFCWGKVDTDEALGSLVRTCCGARDAAVAFGLPFISGKDSLNNEFVQDEAEAAKLGLPARIAIPGTLLISAVGVVPDVQRCVSSDLKEPGHVLALATAPVDRAGWEAAVQLHEQVAALIAAGDVAAVHDVSDGGLAVALAEMCIAGRLGADVTVSPEDYPDWLFDPLLTTYVLELRGEPPTGIGWLTLGRVTAEPHLRISRDRSLLIDLPVAALAEAWRTPLADGGGK